jgi:hypothetical protein
MGLVMLYPAPAAVGFCLGILVFGALIGLCCYGLEAVQPRVRRVLLALLLAVFMAFVVMVVIPDECKGLTPADAMYWLMSCWYPV